jgi:Coenzyme PQQ synthesis protein D (PqqD)
MCTAAKWIIQSNRPNKIRGRPNSIAGGQAFIVGLVGDSTSQQEIFHKDRINTMAISFEDRVIMPREVLISSVEDEAVLLNLNSERYFGLDDVGTRMLLALTRADSIQGAYEALLDEYDVDAEQLRKDLTDLLDKLIEQNLVEVGGNPPAQVSTVNEG